ncbi:hypothetical protein EXIGLDRAFT_696076 [Exidia glandulosa HHB12029]|uniref:Uncharacterized protein n=1 Tax=Exidia glandulosa HHB12029 TaxID=1314781 RepID=A0A165N978_EXIGL|nr:hypothetical protein EXIGLDRAFT_696076 [Exidia glandulosa HHB12029]
MPGSEQHSYLYIALYSREQPGTYDWALANPASPDIEPSSTIVYRVVASTYPGGWTQRTTKLGSPEVDPLPLCLVQLPTIAAPRAELQGFLSEQPAGQGSTPLLSTHIKHGAWTGAQWIVRVLDQLVDADLLDLPSVIRDPSAFYRRVNALGLKAEAEVQLDPVDVGQRRPSATFRRVNEMLVIPHDYAD